MTAKTAGRAAILGPPEVFHSGGLWNLQASISVGADFQPTCMAHPDTYLNKIIIGSKSGKVELWNFISGKRLYTFDFKATVRCLCPSPALDVVAVGLEDG